MEFLPRNFKVLKGILGLGLTSRRSPAGTHKSTFSCREALCIVGGELFESLTAQLLAATAESLMSQLV